MLKTGRGQSARVIKLENGKFSIQLYANGEWGNVAEGYQKEFDTEEQAKEYFANKSRFIHS